MAELRKVYCSSCEQTFETDQMERCPLCRKMGGLVDAAIGNQPQKKSQPTGAEGTYPVSNICPRCGEARFQRVRPTRWIAFAWDRVCTSCHVRYTPPTPTWAAIVFIFAGLLLAGYGGLSLIGSALIPSHIPALAFLPAVAFEGLLGILGVLAIIHGFRVLATGKL